MSLKTPHECDRKILHEYMTSAAVVLFVLEYVALCANLIPPGAVELAWTHFGDYLSCFCDGSLYERIHRIAEGSMGRRAPHSSTLVAGALALLCEYAVIAVSIVSIVVIARHVRSRIIIAAHDRRMRSADNHDPLETRRLREWTRDTRRLVAWLCLSVSICAAAIGNIIFLREAILFHGVVRLADIEWEHAELTVTNVWDAAQKGLRRVKVGEHIVAIQSDTSPDVYWIFQQPGVSREADAQMKILKISFGKTHGNAWRAIDSRDWYGKYVLVDTNGHSLTNDSVTEIARDVIGAQGTVVRWKTVGKLALFVMEYKFPA